MATPVTIFDQGRIGTISIGRSLLTPPGPLELTAIRFWPSCGDTSVPCGSPDPGVFSLGPSAFGTGGACQGLTFAVTAPDETGMVTFTPSSTVVLSTLGSDRNCTLQFVFDVFRVPTFDVLVAGGVQTAASALVLGRIQDVIVISAGGDGTDFVTVDPLVPVLSTQASAPVVVGGALTHTATLGDGVAPAGAVTFRLFGPDDAGCATEVFASVVAVTGNGDYTSAPFTASAPGLYRWIATYGGDGANTTVTGTCNDANETTVVIPATPTLVTVASGPVVVGGALTDTATLADGVGPTGAVTFRLFGPDDATCATEVFASVVAPPPATVATPRPPSPPPPPVSTAGSPPTGATGHAAVTGACNDANETTVVIPATPTLVTVASGPVVVGGPLTDTATLADGVGPTGAVTFRLFGPDDATCATEVFASTVAATGNGGYTSAPFTASAPGLYRWIAAYGGDGANAAVTGACNDAGESTTVIPATPVLSTIASAPVVVGGQLTDTAILAHGVAPTGTMTFALFGPDDPTCATEVFASVLTVAGNGAYTSAPFAATAPGLYRWIAAYGGNGANAAVTGACNDANESTTVIPATPTLVTQASAPVVVGGALTDTATLADGVAPTGAITFRLFGPDDPSCATEVFASTVAVAGDGDYTSAPFTAAAPGLYRWIAAYGGDGANTAVTGACNDAGESTAVIPATPVLSTIASAPVVVGGQLTDTAILAHGVAPTGTMTFALFGPDDPTCATEVFASVLTVAGNGAYTSAPFAATAPGLYRWIAAYGGNGANAAVTGACNDANESTTVIPATPTLVTQASAPVVVGGALTDTATLADGVAPTGALTFRLFGPDDASCATEVFASVAAVTGNGDYTSAPFTASAPGLYRWIAAYGGDGANAAVTGACNDANESTTVIPAPTTTTSTTVAPTTTTSTTVAPTTSTTSLHNDDLDDRRSDNDDADDLDDRRSDNDDLDDLDDRRSEPTTSTTVAPTTTTSTTSTTTAPTTTSTTSAPTTTTVPTTTSAPTTSTAVPTLTTNSTPATTTVPAPTTTTPTTAAPTTTTTTAAPTTTTAVQTTTTLPAPPVDRGPPPSKPTLSASGTGSTAASPPGSVLDVDGKGYGECAQVYFFLDGGPSRRTSPTAAGSSTSASTSPVTYEPANTPSRRRAARRAPPSRRRRWFSSRPRASSLGGHHRHPQAVRHRPQPEVGRGQRPVHHRLPLACLVPRRAARFDGRRALRRDPWLVRLRPSAEKVTRERGQAFRGIAFVGFLLAGGIAGAFLDPSVSPGLTSAALAVGLATSLAVVFVCFSLPGIIYMRRHHQDRGQNPPSAGGPAPDCHPGPHVTGPASGARLPVRPHRRPRLRNGAQQGDPAAAWPLRRRSSRWASASRHGSSGSRYPPPPPKET